MFETTFLRLFSPPGDPALLTYGTYNPWLVVLSVLLAVFASWMALQMAGQAATALSRPLRITALLTSSLALGCGVWAMHFIGMLAFNLCTPVDYDPTITVWSMMPSIAASMVALSLIGRKRIGTLQLVGGGVLVGAGIGTMHYAGMAAMQMSLSLRYDPLMFGLSILVAVALSTLALWVRFGLSGLRKTVNGNLLTLVSATVMGCAIAGMHYTGMAAARFVGQVSPGFGGTENLTFIAIAVSLMTVVFTILVMSTNGLLRYRELYRHLSQSESGMRTLLTTIVDGVIVLDSAGGILEFNASAERIFGWTKAEVIGRNIRMLIADQNQSNREGVLNFLETRDTEIFGKGSEVLGLRKDGVTVDLRRTLGYARLADQDMFLCVVTDISERNAMERALRDNEQQFRSLITNIPGISFRGLMKPGLPMVFISDAIELFSGYPAADFLGATPKRLYRNLIHCDDRDLVIAAIAKAIGEGQPFQIEYRLLHRDGSLRWMWENGCAVLDDHGEVKWLDGVIVDITERQQMEEDLRDAKNRAEQAAAARAAFLANMSHEIRTPMHCILGFTDILLQADMPPEQHRHLDNVRNAARSLMRLLNEILDTAKLDKGAVELEMTDFNLLTLIDELSSTLGSLARNKGLFFNIHYDSDLPLCFYGDELRVRQVLTNLLGNAVKFTEAGHITLSVEPDNGKLHFIVRDTGIGIAQDRLSAIFDPFVQADSSLSRRYGGTGLGTTISKQLVELMGGRIWAESTLGEGSVFHVVLPLTAATRASVLPGAPDAAVALPPLRILVADDVPQNLELISLQLGKEGHTLITASDGAAAADMADREHFDRF